MSIDLTPNEVKETPAVPAKQFPLSFMRLLTIQAGSPQQVRAYAEFCPYRRITDSDGGVVGGEFKTPDVDGDITVISTDNIMDLANSDAAGEALVEQTIGQFMSQGGNIHALAMAAIVLAFKMRGISEGKFQQ